MKKTNIKYYLGAFLMLFAASSCEDQLDINDNPNSATAADVQLVLPQAIVASANIANQYNSYGGHFGGFIANAGGFSGFGNLLNYNLTPADWNGLWVNTYQDPLQDLKYVLDKTEGVDQLSYFNAAAKIMTVVNYQRLVDAFGDIPYSQALQADKGIVSPAYDNAFDIYQDLYAKLDQAIATIDGAQFPLRLTKANDPLFGSTTSSERPIAEQMLDWKKYANTLKLRILIRLSRKTDFASFVSTGYASLNTALGFLDTDAIVDPGYELNRPNPTWATWGRTVALALSNSSRIPTRFAFGFYSGAKIADLIRGELTYVNYPSTPTNQLGNEDGAPTVVSNTVTWASNESTIAGYSGRGVLKGAGMGAPLMLAAESYFLQAEAELDAHDVNAALTMAQLFEAGKEASFRYLLLDENEALGFPASFPNMAAVMTKYNVTDNPTNRLVNIGLATNDDQRREAIITQKYIALNMINSDEAWNEYRRTGYPVSTPGGAPAVDIASNKSNISSRGDRLPTRVLYPSSEQAYNAANFRVIDYNSELIFWDPN
jgi:hypothetical protein